MKRNRLGQATTEMVFVLPLLVMMAAGAMFIVYSCWQGIKVQQAANLAARIQGQEKVAGGTTVGDISRENGSDMNGDQDPTQQEGKFEGRANPVSGQSVYARLHQMAKEMFPRNVQSEVFIPKPEEGQNFDKIKVIRVINLPKLPFFKWKDDQAQLKLQGTAWGGEDTYMYGLPRWGTSPGSGGRPEWQNMMRQSKDPNATD